jgi:hypothetical protein
LKPSLHGGGMRDGPRGLISETSGTELDWTAASNPMRYKRFITDPCSAVIGE